MNNKLMVNGAEISVTTIDDKDYISLTDMLKAKATSSSLIGFGIGIPLNFLAFGSRSTTRILIMANSP